MGIEGDFIKGLEHSMIDLFLSVKGSLMSLHTVISIEVRHRLRKENRKKRAMRNGEKLLSHFSNYYLFAINVLARLALVGIASRA